jgi:hypothetical protein
LVYISYPIMGSRIAWRDGLTSVRRAYTPDEIRSLIEEERSAIWRTRTEIFRRYLYRMGVIVWKRNGIQQSRE